MAALCFLVLLNLTVCPDAVLISPASCRSVPHAPDTGLSRVEIGASPVIASSSETMRAEVGAVAPRHPDSPVAVAMMIKYQPIIPMSVVLPLPSAANKSMCRVFGFVSISNCLSPMSQIRQESHGPTNRPVRVSSLPPTRYGSRTSTRAGKAVPAGTAPLSASCSTTRNSIPKSM